MSTTENTTISISKKLAAKIGYFLLIVILIILFWVLRDKKVDRMISEQQILVSQTIINTINEQAKLDLFKPDLVLIDMESSQKEQMNDSLYKRLSAVLISKYLDNNKINTDDSKFQPFCVLQDSIDKNGNYNLTKKQLEELRNHIQFLTSQVEKAVVSVKDEIGKDIDRLNTWVSIWIGIIGFLGIFIPIVLNYRNSEELKEISIKADVAANKVNKVDDYIAKNEKHIEELKSLPPELKVLKQTFDGFKGEVTTAKETSKKALQKAETANTTANKVEMLVTTLNNISKIKDIDATFLLYNNKPFETLSSYLIEIHLTLSNCSELFAEPIIKDVFRQLALKLHLIAPIGFIGPENFDLLNQFALDVSRIISKEILKENYDQLIGLLGQLNSSIVKT
ncbi:MAG TPA: hypothetical protein DEO70_06650 [Bacteroidales bacterium]|nr:MAG: hypothetical protein A2X11_08690 [Bacteroidetes bacterium GWE2_42_24]OFY31861.1 MAG: hypothetical protein A2X09_09785 [Bacteroidetes bacterium GWF2_43_11]HBZ66499.1 hypothetical protein [Bacteroidales bacterium]